MPMLELADGSTVLLLLPGSHADFEAQGVMTDKVKLKLAELSQRSGQLLLEAVQGLRTALGSVAPSSLEIELGVSISQQGSIIISSAKAEASLTIKAVWKKGDGKDG